VAFLTALTPRLSWACAACYGQSDSPLAAAMNWGILSLLGVIGVVLGGVAAFFVFLAKRSAAQKEPILLPQQAEFQHFAAAGRSDFSRGRHRATLGRRRSGCRASGRARRVAVRGTRG